MTMSDLVTLAHSLWNGARMLWLGTNVSATYPLHLTVCVVAGNNRDSDNYGECYTCTLLLSE